MAKAKTPWFYRKISYNAHMTTFLDAPLHSAAPIAPFAPALNSLQVLWLKELGIDQLWGETLQAQVTPSMPAVSSVAAPQVSSSQEHAALAAQQKGGVQQSLGVQAVAAEQSSLGGQSGRPAVVQAAKSNNFFSKLRADISAHQQQPKNRRLQRNQSLRQTESPSIEGLDWQQLQSYVQNCEACALHKGRTQAVFGELGEQASLMIIDEMPGKEDDLSGHLFDSRSGQLLDNMLAAIHLDRESVLLTSLLKCRSADGAPSDDSLQQCQHYLLAQIQLLQPRCILVLGRAAFSFLQQEPVPFERLRGQVWQYTTPEGQEIPVVVSYHPSYLMIHQEDKALAWHDLKLVAQVLQQHGNS